jgi:hypothetical protein
VVVLSEECKSLQDNIKDREAGVKSAIFNMEEAVRYVDRESIGEEAKEIRREQVRTEYTRYIQRAKDALKIWTDKTCK